MAPRKQLSGLDLNNQQIKNLADASAATDAVTLQQVQAYVRGLSWKQAVMVASTGNVTVATPGATINGYSLNNNDRVLLKNQTTASENGIYVWNGASAAMTRPPDASQGTLVGGSAVYVELGTVNPDTMWTLITDDPITVGTTSLAWAQLGGASAPYTAGNGLALNANQFSVQPIAGGGIAVSSSGVSVDRTKVPNIYAADVPSGSTAAAISHGLNTLDTIVRVYEKSGGAEVDVDVVHTSITVNTLNFAVAPTTGQYRVVVLG